MGSVILKAHFAFSSQHQEASTLMPPRVESCFHCSFSGLSAAEREIEMDWTSTISNLHLMQRAVLS